MSKQPRSSPREVLGTALVRSTLSDGPPLSGSREGTRDERPVVPGLDLAVVDLDHEEQMEDYKRAVEKVILERFYSLERKGLLGQAIHEQHEEHMEEYKQAVENLILERFYALETSIARMLQEGLAPVRKLPPRAAPGGPSHYTTDGALPPEMLGQLEKMHKAAELRAVDERCRLTEQIVFDGIKSLQATLQREMDKQSELIAQFQPRVQPDAWPLDAQTENADTITRFQTRLSCLSRGEESEDKTSAVRSIKFADVEDQRRVSTRLDTTATSKSVVTTASSDPNSVAKRNKDHSTSFFQASGLSFSQAPSERRELFKTPHQATMSSNTVHALLQRFVHSDAFTGFITVCIVLNLVMKVIQMDIDMRRAIRNEQQVSWGHTVDMVFTITFIVELLARIAADHYWFFFGRHKGWNMFDLVVVMCSVLEILTDGLSLNFLRIFRSFRLVRALKIIRVFRFFRELRLMAVSIASCLVSLFWALIMIFLVILVFAMFVMEGSRHHLLGNSATADTRSSIATMYGSFPEAAYSLIKAISGGGDWGDFAQPLLEVSWMYGMGFALFVCFVTLGMMNILIGIFVENAQQYSKLDRDLVIQQEMDQRKRYMNQLRDLFNEIDDENTGTMTYNGFNECLSAERAQAYLDFLQLNASEAQGLFMLLDLDENGVVSVEDFVLGCMRLKGNAKSVDAAAMMYQTKRLAVKVNELFVYTQERLELLIRLALGREVTEEIAV